MQSGRTEFVHCDHKYLSFKGSKFSKSRGAFVDVPYFLSRYDPDALRFYLTAVAPETRDTEFAWEDFVERNNNELVATWGNLCQRPRRALGFMLSFAYKRFDGRVPEPGELDDEDRALLEKVEAGFETVGELYNACKFRAALSKPPRSKLRGIVSGKVHIGGGSPQTPAGHSSPQQAGGHPGRLSEKAQQGIDYSKNTNRGQGCALPSGILGLHRPVASPETRPARWGAQSSSS